MDEGNRDAEPPIIGEFDLALVEPDIVPSLSESVLMSRTSSSFASCR
jgi:hypothetical protein